MRVAPFIGAVAVLALSGCAMPSVNNMAADRADRATGRPVPTLAVSGPGPSGACTAAWNGEPVTRETLLARGVAELERVIAAAGGIGQLQEIPPFRVEAAATMPWACVAPWLEVVGRTGFARAQIATGAGDQAAPFLAFLLGEAPSVPVPLPVVTVGAEGRFLWDGVAVDTAGLRQRLAARGYGSDEAPPEEAPPTGSSSEAPPPVVAAPPGGWSLVPGEGATVGTMREALRILAAAGIEPELRGAATGDSRTPAPPPPDPLANRR